MQREAPQFFQSAEAGPARAIAFLREEGRGAGPDLVWLGGFRSDMRATKAEALAAWAREQGRGLLRFDYSGHGESGGRFEEASISQWLADALGAVRAHSGPNPVLVGSSMGGWLALLAARALRGEACAPSGLLLIAPAVDFTEELMWASLNEEARRAIMQDGQWLRPSSYASEPYPITRRLIEDGRRHLLFGKPIEPGCPVAILQGMQDPDVPYAHALQLVEHLPGEDVALTLVKDGDHRLSRPQDIERLLQTVGAFSARSPS
jgi:pimeloyl-ACP methyl ester carboxylesterase